jgi:hypothetical protein
MRSAPWSSSRQSLRVAEVHPVLSDAVRAGRAAATTFSENKLIAVANGKPVHAQAIQWVLRNRSRATSGGHHDAQRVEHYGPDGQPVQIAARDVIDPRSLSDERRDKVLEVLEAIDVSSINEAEAETIRYIFRRYAELGTVSALQADLKQQGCVFPQSGVSSLPPSRSPWSPQPGTRSSVPTKPRSVLIIRSEPCSNRHRRGIRHGSFCHRAEQRL